MTPSTETQRMLERMADAFASLSQMIALGRTPSIAAGDVAAELLREAARSAGAPTSSFPCTICGSDSHNAYACPRYRQPPAAPAPAETTAPGYWARPQTDTLPGPQPVSARPDMPGINDDPMTAERAIYLAKAGAAAAAPVPTPPVQGKPQVHDLKVWREFWPALVGNLKPFEVRLDDRDYRVGDTLRLRCFDERSNDYTGPEINRLVTYILDGGKFGIQAGHIVMGLANLPPTTTGESGLSTLAEIQERGRARRAELCTGPEACRQEGCSTRCLREYLEELETELANVSTPRATEGDAVCTFGIPAERKRHWILKFEDADVGDMHFDDEEMAHDQFKQCSVNWNCTLFVTATQADGGTK